MNVTAFSKLKSVLNDGGFCGESAEDLIDDITETVRSALREYQGDTETATAVEAFEFFLEQHRGMTVDQLIDEFRQLRAVRGDG